MVTPLVNLITDGYRPVRENVRMTTSGAPELTRRHRQHAATATVPGPPRLLRGVAPLGVSAVLGWEIALLAVLVAWAHHDAAVTIGLAVLAIALIAVTSVRVGGDTAAGRLAARYRMRRRLAHYPDDRTDTARARLLAGLTLNSHIDRAGNRTGVIGAGLGWSAAVRIADTAVPDVPALIDIAGRACARADLPLAAAQVLTWTVPSGDGRVLRQYFIAVRTSPRRTARAIAARGGGPAGAQRAAASAIAAVAFELSRIGCPAGVIDSVDLEQYVQLLSGSAGEARPVETGDSWAVGHLRQTCLRVASGTPVTTALNRVVAEPLGFVIASCTLTPGRRGAPRQDFLVRAGLAEQPAPLTVEQAVRATDPSLTPLRYRQEEHVRATLPLALSADGAAGPL